MAREILPERLPVMEAAIDVSLPAAEVPVLPGAGAELLDLIFQFIGRFVCYPSAAEQNAHALWVAHTHLMNAWASTPRIGFLSPEPWSGKTRAIEVTKPIVPRPVEAV